LAEIFKPIKNYPRYYVSNYGNVLSLVYKYPKILTKIVSNNYFAVGLYVGQDVKVIRIHRLVAEAFIKNPNKYKVINHKDGNKKNNNVTNLENKKENIIENKMELKVTTSRELLTSLTPKDQNIDKPMEAKRKLYSK
jgi:hypothetical protein